MYLKIGHFRTASFHTIRSVLNKNLLFKEKQYRNHAEMSDFVNEKKHFWPTTNHTSCSFYSWKKQTN